VWVHICVYKHRDTDTHRHRHRHTYTYVYIYIYIYIYICTHTNTIYIYKYTHIHKQRKMQKHKRTLNTRTIRLVKWVPFGYFPAKLLFARLKEGLLSAEGYFPAKLLLAKLGLGSFCSTRAQDFNPVFGFCHVSRWVRYHRPGEGVGVGKEYFAMGTSPRSFSLQS